MAIDRFFYTSSKTEDESAITLLDSLTIGRIVTKSC